MINLYFKGYPQGLCHSLNDFHVITMTLSFDLLI